MKTLATTAILGAAVLALATPSASAQAESGREQLPMATSKVETQQFI